MMRLSRWMSIAVLLAAGLPFALTPQAPAEAPQQVATVDKLKTDAYAALRDGNFAQGNDLMAKAAAMSPDPQTKQMAELVNQFEIQRQQFTAERHKQYDKAVADVHKLLDHHFDSYALDAAAKAGLLSDDKEKFRHEPWVDALVKQSIEMAAQFDSHEEWLKSMRLYADLSSIEPANPEWKDKLKLVTRRIRLLALYTPGGIKALQDAEQKERDQVDQLLAPTTQKSTTQLALAHPAATQPSSLDANKPPDEDDNPAKDAFKVDWHETVRGVKLAMLTDAIKNAVANYYRPVEYKNLLLGGIKGLRALVTTKGLEQTFPGLGDANKCKTFLDSLDRRAVEAEAAGTNSAVVDSVLERILKDDKDTINVPKEVIISEFGDGAFAELDPFSSIIWPTDMEEFTKATQGEFSGVGIQIQSDDDGSLRVVSPLEDSPAFKAGIKAGDVVTRINGKNAKNISLTQAVKTITGQSGTHVVLTVRSPDNVVKDYDLERKTIHVASLKGWSHRPGGGWDYFVDPTSKIAYLRLTSFTRTSGEELNKVTDELREKGVKAMILDLRYNPGGLLSAATEVCDKFLSSGTIVSTHADRETPNPPTIATAQPDDDEVKVPLVVLVNQYSASASEIVSGALKDDKRARVIGERTFGKGSVQMLFPLARDEDNRPTAYLKLTTSHYYLPNGKCIHREENSTTWGVDPDLTIEMTPEQMRAEIDARQQLDVLREANDPATTQNAKPAVSEKTKTMREAVAKAVKDPIASDPQLGAAVLLLRMQLMGAKL